MHVPRTIIHELVQHGVNPAIDLVGPNGVEPRAVSRAELLERAASAASALAERGVRAGDRVVFNLPTSLELLVGLLGTWWLGAATIVLPHDTRGTAEASRRRRGETIRAAAPRLVVAPAGARHDLALPETETALLAAEELLAPRPGRPLERDLPGTDDLAHVQFSSGTTGGPKGIALRHRQILANVDAIGRRLRVGADDKVVSWLPLFHDMGFFGMLCALVWRVPLRLAATETFVADPTSWLRAISEDGGTLSPAPTFAYGLIGQRVRRRGLRGPLDLSRWRYGWVGAEPVSASVLDAFEAGLAPAGLGPHAVRPCYGLAEATLAVTMPRPGVARRSLEVERAALAPRAAGAASRVTLVGVGHALDNVQIEIRDRAGAPERAPDGVEGRVFVRGESVTDAILGAAVQPDRDGWLDTGDLGLLDGGELFVTGRTKDLIIRAGINVHPHEIERVAETVEGVRASRSAAFSVLDDRVGRELVVVVVEAGRAADVQRIRREVSTAVSTLVGVQCDEVEVVGIGAVPRTTSGKIQRSLCRELLLAGRLHAAASGDEEA